MGDATGIAWTDRTWNPWYGCIHVSPGCDNCYMYRDMTRYGRDPQVVKRAAAHTFNSPKRWLTGRVFTCSWSDFFITEADAWRGDAWKLIRDTPWLTYQVLTKRPVLIERRLPDGWENEYASTYRHVWIGVSVENREQLKRLDVLKDIPNVMPWVSAEPLLEDISVELATGRYDWVKWWVWGGESGPKARPYDIAWPISGMQALPKATHFHKQVGSNACHGAHRLPTVDRAGADPLEWIPELQVRNFPR